MAHSLTQIPALSLRLPRYWCGRCTRNLIKRHSLHNSATSSVTVKCSKIRSVTQNTCSLYRILRCLLAESFTAVSFCGMCLRDYMRWVGHVARMGEERGCIGSWWGNRREGDHWGDLGVDGWIILGWISRRWDVGIWTGLGWPRIETGGGRLWVR